jgi:MFS family permease
MTPHSPAASFPSADRGDPLPGARWALGLLLSINLFNYIDRQVLAAVVPSIEREFFPWHYARRAMLSWCQQAFGFEPERELDFGVACLRRFDQRIFGGMGFQIQEALCPSQNSLTPFLDWFQRAFGFEPMLALIGTLAMAFMIVYTVTAPIFGRMAERCSRWVLVGVAIMLWSLASGASGLATSFLMLLVTRCFVGIGEAAYGPVAPSVLSDFYPVKVRGRVLAWFYMAIPVGSASGYLLGGLMAGLNSDHGWRWAFYLVVVPGIVLGLCCFFMHEPPRGQADLAVEAPFPRLAWKDYRILLRTPSYILCTLGMTAMTFALGGIGFWMVYYLQEKRGLTESSAIVFGTITVVAGLVATLLGGMAGDRLRARCGGSYFLVSGIAMLAGLPMFLAVLYVPFPWAWGCIFMACFCLFFNTGPTNTILANVTHPAMRATAFALNIFVIHSFGDVISPVIIGMIADKHQGDMNMAFQVVGFMFLVSGTVWLLGMRFLARDTALASLRLGRMSAGLQSLWFFQTSRSG